MCRLFGLIADSAVNLENPILKGMKPFIDLSHKHHDGWGIGYLSNNSGQTGIRIVKAPVPAYRDEHFSSLFKRLISPLVIVHLRDAKYGEVAPQNTHPFYAEGWVFAHNGAIERYRDMERELRDVKLEGETDSERYFRLLLKHIRRKGDTKQGILSAIQWLEANGFEGAKNFLMSDGRRLYAYRDGRTLYYVARETPPVLAGYSKDTIDPDLGATQAKTKKVIIVASEILTAEDWHEVPEGHLVEIDENLDITIELVLDKTITYN